MDFIFSNSGSLWLCTPQNKPARAHLDAHLSEAQRWAGGVAVEPRYVQDLVNNLRDAGYTVGGAT